VFGGGVVGGRAAVARVNSFVIFVGYPSGTSGCPQRLSLTRPGQIAMRLTAVRITGWGAPFAGRLFLSQGRGGDWDSLLHY
jgi:hypothetical protein